MEAVSGTMDAHLRYFKQVVSHSTAIILTFYLHLSHSLPSTLQGILMAGLFDCFDQGYELLHQMEPYIQQVCLFVFLGVYQSRPDI